MPSCTRCGSFAINHNHHGRDESDGDLCDVCYWRKRADQTALHAARYGVLRCAPVGEPWGLPRIALPESSTSGEYLNGDDADAAVDAVLATSRACADMVVQDAFQRRVAPWMLECFGEAIARDITERGDRFLEEALELLQATGYDPSRVPTLLDYVYRRPIGEKPQEVGGVMVTLAALCLAIDVDMHDAGEVELARIWTKIDVIRAKQESKRGLHTPLPASDRPSEHVV